MAKASFEIPDGVLKQFADLENDTEVMLGAMVESGADIVLKNVRSNMAKAFKDTKTLDKGLKRTKVYKTPSDDGVNEAVGFYGYDDDGVPIPLKAMAREYGTSRGESKKPFFRKSFKKSEIESAMQQVQDKYIKGDT